MVDELVEDKEYICLDHPEESYDHPSPDEREHARNLSATSYNTQDNFAVIPQFKEFSCATFKSHDIRKLSEYAYMRLSKLVKVEYHEIYGSVEKQSLVCKQLGWDDYKGRSYSTRRRAIKARGYRQKMPIEDKDEVQEQDRVAKAKSRFLSDIRTSRQKMATKAAKLLEG